MDTIAHHCDKVLQSVPSGRSSEKLQAIQNRPLVVGESAVSTQSRCEPRAVFRRIVASISQQPFHFTDKLFKQVRLLIEDSIDI